MENETRLFFVVDSREDNEEIFTTLEDAQAYFISSINAGDGGRLYIAIVRHAYKEDTSSRSDSDWNYEDLSDTFEIIKILEEKQ